MQALRNRWIGTVALVLGLTAAGGVSAAEERKTAGSTERRVQNANRRIIVSIPARKLALIEDGRIVKVYPTAVGKEKSPSPTGTFRIITRIPNPTYYRPGAVIRPGAANPVGTRWRGLSLKVVSGCAMPTWRNCSSSCAWATWWKSTPSGPKVWRRSSKRPRKARTLVQEPAPPKRWT